MAVFRPAGGVEKVAVFQTQFAGARVHLCGECGLATGQALGDHNARVITRLHDDAAQQIVDPNPAAHLDKHL